MTYEEAQEVIKKISYKPWNNKHGGWLHLSIVEKDKMYKLSVSITNPDSYNNSGVISVSATFERLISAQMLNSLTPFFFVKIIRNLIIEGELHEVDEFIRYDGNMVFDPHEDKEL